MQTHITEIDFEEQIKLEASTLKPDILILSQQKQCIRELNK